MSVQTSGTCPWCDHKGEWEGFVCPQCRRESTGTYHGKGGNGYFVHRPPSGWAKAEDIPEAEITYLRPIAETLAMMDGNAFFGTTKDDAGDDTWFRCYLPEAKAIFDANGGLDGWAGTASFVRRLPSPPEALSK